MIFLNLQLLKINKIFRLRFLLIFPCQLIQLSISLGQIPNYIWAKSVGGKNSEITYSVTTDGSGNVLIAGGFTDGTLNLGSNTLVNTAFGYTDMFLAKYDSNGNVLWAKSAGGTSNDLSFSITSDALENIVVVGYFSSPTITFDSITLINNSNSYDMFIAKYNSAGNLLWVKSLNGIYYYDVAYAVATDPLGNIFVCGAFSGLLIFDSDTLISKGYQDAFLVKYDSSGTVLWAKSAGGKGNDEKAFSVSTDHFGNVVVGGLFYSSSMDLDSITLFNIDKADSTSDMFLAKYDPTGNILWSNSLGGMSYDESYAITSDTSGNVFMTGNFFSQTITIDSTIFTKVGRYDIIIVKYNASGKALWAKSAGGNSDDILYSVSTDVSGNVFIAGGFSSQVMTFNSQQLVKPDISDIYSDIFLAKYDVIGNFEWAKATGGNDNDIARSIALDKQGNLFLTGSYLGRSISFDSIILTNSDSIYSSSDIFIAKLGVGTGIENTKNVDQFKIYPNPTTGIFQIKTNNILTENKNEIEIFNLTGVRIYHSEFGISNAQIDLHDYPNGIYFINVNTVKSKYYQKLIINK